MDLVQILTAFVIAYLKGKYPIKELGDVMAPVNRAKVESLIPEFKGAFVAYEKGKDFDWPTLAKGIKEFASRYAKMPRAKTSFLKTLRAYASYYANSTESALKVIEKLTAEMDDPFIRSYFVKQAIGQDDVNKSLAPVVKKLGGKGNALTLDEAKAAKDADPELYKQYLALRRTYSESWKLPLSNYVRNSGKETVPLAEVLAHLKSHGIKADVPEGFTGRIDANGLWYTSKGKKIAGGAPSPKMFPKVRMNPEYDEAKSPWVFQAIRSTGEAANYFYTEEFQRAQSKAKFEKVKAFDVEKTRKKWLPLISQFDPADPSPQSIAAVELEILYRSSNRIGTRVQTDPKAGGFGISTLLCAHLYPQTDGSIKFIYSGKDSVKTVTVIKKSDDKIAAQVCKAVLALAEGKKPRDPLFTYNLKNGTFRIVQPAVVQKLFQQCAGVPGLTVHKLRTAAGSRIFREFMDTTFAKKSTLAPEKVMELCKQGATLVAKQLNHVRRSAEGAQVAQPMTSLVNYIDPALQAEFFLNYGAPFPNYLEKLLKDEDGLSMVHAAAEPLDVNGASGEDAERIKEGDVGTPVAETTPSDGITEDEVARDLDTIPDYV